MPKLETGCAVFNPSKPSMTGEVAVRKILINRGEKSAVSLRTQVKPENAFWKAVGRLAEFF